MTLLPIETSPSGASVDLRDPSARLSEELRGETSPAENGQPGGRAALHVSIGGSVTRECSMCSQPSPGLTCERCMRYEIARPAVLLAYDHAALDEMADSALDAARYWAHQSVVLRAEAARRAE